MCSDTAYIRERQLETRQRTVFPRTARLTPLLTRGAALSATYTVKQVSKMVAAK